MNKKRGGTLLFHYHFWTPYVEETEKFYEDHIKNLAEKSKYRGILRAQLSAIELLMLFYNISYSSKGEKFRSLLMEKNFFDNHLVIEDFIWRNDFEELKKLNS